MNSKISLFFPVFFIVLLVVIFGIVLYPPVPNKVSVSQSTQPTPEQTAPTPEVQTVPLPTLLATPSRSLEITIRLLNAMKEPVPNGVLSLAGQVLNSPTSEFVLSHLSSGSIVLAASAEGYLSATREITIPSDLPIELVLEYSCDFRVTVLEKNKIQEGVKVVLYEGPPVPRPITEYVTIQSRSDNVTGEIILQKVVNGIQIVKVVGEPALAKLESSSSSPTWIKPEVGDVVLDFTPDTIQTVSARKTISSLCLWDSITSIYTTDKQKSNAGFLILQRGNAFLRLPTFGLIEVNTDRFVSNAYTDRDGVCVFKNLAPRIYYVQAIKDEQKSNVAMLLPCDQSLTLVLPESVKMANTGSLQVDVSMAVLENFNTNNRIPGANVLVAGLDQFIVFSDETNSNGYTIFENMPLGRYRITITPPATYKAIPFSQQLEYELKEKLVKIPVVFQTDYGVTLSGVVQRVDTEESVSDYPIILQRDLRSDYKLKEPEQEKMSIFDDFASTTSDKKGCFQFHHIKAGKYRIYGYAALGYTHPSAGKRLTRVSNQEPPFWVENQDVQDLFYHVIPCKTTTLKGRVVREKNEPVRSASIKIGKLFQYITSGNLSTNANGEFLIELSIPQDVETIETTLVAQVPAPPLETKTLQNSGTMETVFRKNGFSEEGRTEISVKNGESLTNINIVLEPADRGCTLYGSIKTPEGITPNFVEAYNIRVSQPPFPDSTIEYEDHLRSYVRINADGSYTVDQLHPGLFRLFVSPVQIKIPNQQTVSLPPETYATENIYLEMPEDQPSLQFDVILKKNSYIRGKIIGSDFKPVTGIEVEAHNPIEPLGWISGGAKVDYKGNFLMILPPGSEYDLHVRKKSEEIPFASMKVTPPVDNLIFQIREQLYENKE